MALVILVSLGIAGGIWHLLHWAQEHWPWQAALVLHLLVFGLMIWGALS
jgi:hypothetical protein